MVTNINNVKLKHLQKIPEQQQNEYRNILQYLKPKDVLKGHSAANIFWLSFDKVDMLKRAVSSPDPNSMVDIFQIVFGIDKKKLVNCRLIEFYHAYNYVLKEITSIVERENETLNFEHPDPKHTYMLKQAGIERMNTFGVLNTLDALALRYNTHPEIVKEWPYGYCYSLLLKMNFEKQIEAQYNEIVKANSKKK